jgi:hypothetical protein
VLVGLFPLGKQVVPTDVPLTWRTAVSSIERSRVA